MYLWLWALCISIIFHVCCSREWVENQSDFSALSSCNPYLPTKVAQSVYKKIKNGAFPFHHLFSLVKKTNKLMFCNFEKITSYTTVLSLYLHISPLPSHSSMVCRHHDTSPLNNSPSFPKNEFIVLFTEDAVVTPRKHNIKSNIPFTWILPNCIKIML